MINLTACIHCVIVKLATTTHRKTSRHIIFIFISPIGSINSEEKKNKQQKKQNKILN